MANQPPKKKTTSVVVATSKKIRALTAQEVNLDYGVNDFCKWIYNFDSQTGHFLGTGKAEDFGVYLYNEIANMGGYIDMENVETLCNYIVNEARAYPGWFVSVEAAKDFARQVRGYVEVDGYIGVKPGVDKPTGDGGQRRTTSRLSGKPRSSVSRSSRRARQRRAGR